MLILFWPGVIVLGTVTFFLHFTSFREQRMRGSYGNTNLFVLLWMVAFLGFFALAYKSYFPLLHLEIHDLWISPSAYDEFWNFYWSALLSSIIFLTLALLSFYERVIIPRRKSIQ
ncbi:MAG: hypothetical protein ACFFEJ_18095 [Candidatus Thorarchaeota archaeon]